MLTRFSCCCFKLSWPCSIPRKIRGVFFKLWGSNLSQFFRIQFKGARLELLAPILSALNPPRLSKWLENLSSIPNKNQIKFRGSCDAHCPCGSSHGMKRRCGKSPLVATMSWVLSMASWLQLEVLRCELNQPGPNTQTQTFVVPSVRWSGHQECWHAVTIRWYSTERVDVYKFLPIILDSSFKNRQ